MEQLKLQPAIDGLRAKGKSINKLAYETCFEDSEFRPTTSSGLDRYKVAAKNWDAEAARVALGVPIIPEKLRTEHPHSVKGYSTSDGIFVYDYAPLPIGVLVHEMGHYLLGHQRFLMTFMDPRQADVVEAQASMVSLMVAWALDLELDAVCSLTAIAGKVPPPVLKVREIVQPAEEVATRIYNAGFVTAASVAA